jgi:hypothetical protein
VWGTSDTIFKGARQENFPVLKVPRQYPLVLLEYVVLREGNALGSEKIQGLGCGLVMSREEKTSRGHCCCIHGINFDINVGRAELESHFC